MNPKGPNQRLAARVSGDIAHARALTSAAGAWPGDFHHVDEPETFTSLIIARTPSALTMLRRLVAAGRARIVNLERATTLRQMSAVIPATEPAPETTE